MEKNVNEQAAVTADVAENKMVMISQIIFKGKRKIDWENVETFLLKYVGRTFRIEETQDDIYIGRDFPDEFSNSVYTKSLKGALGKTKANMAQGVPELLRIAYNKRWVKNYKQKHKKSAKYGWYRYSTRFVMIVEDNSGRVKGVNTYSAIIVVRHASDNKLYLYDILNIKKETSKPP